MQMTSKNKAELLGKIDRVLEVDPVIYDELYYYVARLERSLNWEHHCQTVSKNDDEFEQFLYREP